MATVDEVLAKAAEWEAAGNPANAAKLRAYAETLKPKYDAASIEAKAAEWEKAGQPDKAAKLRDYAATLAPSQPITASTKADDGPQAPPRALSPAEERQKQIDDFTLFEMANPKLKGKYKLGDALPKSGEAIMAGAGTAKSGPMSTTVLPWRSADIRSSSDTFGETAGAMMEGPIAGMKAFGAGITGGESPSRNFLANDPATSWLPGPVLTGLGAVGDIGGAGLSAVGAGMAGAAGLGSELVPGQNAADERKLAQDVLDMSMFAVPELAGGSSVPARVASASPKVAAVAEKVAPKVASIAEVGEMARKASSGGMGAVKAREALALEAKVNPEAMAAAERLGIDLPMDVFSESQSVREIAGHIRSKVGSEASAIWRDAVKGARDKADEIMAAMDGSPDIASVSEKVKGALSSARDGLKSAASKLYDEVDAKVPKSTKAETSNLVKYLNRTLADVGGEARLSAAEKRLLSMATGREPLTYGALIREKSTLGEAIGRNQNPFPDMDMGAVKRMYGALAEDQLATVTAQGDDALRATLREANQITAKQKGLEDRIRNAFGNTLDGSIGAALRNAISKGAKGDIGALNRVIKTVPEDLQRETITSALAASTRSARATEPGFGLAEFAKMFGGIKTNKPVYNLIGSKIGAEAMGVLNDLYSVARNIVRADANVLRTGKANQALIDAATAEGVIGRLMHSSTGQKIARGASLAGGAATMGPTGAVIADGIASTLLAKPDVMAKLGKLFVSDEFQAALAKSANEAAAMDAISKTRPFIEWAKSAGINVRDVLAGSAEKVAVPGVSQSTSDQYEPLWKRYAQ